MAQAPTSLSINDGSATPVAITFTTVKATPELSVFKDKRLAKVAYWPEISLSASLPSATAKVRKADFRVAYPVVDPITGLVTDIARFRDGVFDIPVSMGQTDVNHFYAFVKNGLANPVIQAAIRDMDTLIG